MSPLQHIFSDSFAMLAILIMLGAFIWLITNPHVKAAIDENKKLFANPEYVFKTGEQNERLHRLKLGISYWRKSLEYKQRFLFNSPMLKRAKLNR